MYLVRIGDRWCRKRCVFAFCIDYKKFDLSERYFRNLRNIVLDLFTRHLLVWIQRPTIEEEAYRGQSSRRVHSGLQFASPSTSTLDSRLSPNDTVWGHVSVPRPFPIDAEVRRKRVGSIRVRASLDPSTTNKQVDCITKSVSESISIECRE